MLCFDYESAGETGPGRWMLGLLGNYILTTRIPPCGFNWIHALLSVPGMCWSHPQSSHIPAQDTGAVSRLGQSWRVFWNESRSKGDGLWNFYISFVYSQGWVKAGFSLLWWNCSGLGRLGCPEILPTIQLVPALQWRFVWDDYPPPEKELSKVESDMSSCKVFILERRETIPEINVGYLFYNLS